jgi:hypothetical protein
MLSKKLSALVALSLITVSSAAVAQSAQSLSIVPAARAGHDLDGENALGSRNGYGIYIIGAIVIGLAVWGIIELTKNKDDSPESP